MTTIPKIFNEPSKCSQCGTNLTTFAAYIPGKGEACMKCYIEAAKKEEAGNN
jgi:recombinational DNA repair protein (RecF pathway)